MTDDNETTNNDALFLNLYCAALTGICGRVSVDSSKAANEAFIVAERAIERLESGKELPGEGQRTGKALAPVAPAADTAPAVQTPDANNAAGVIISQGSAPTGRRFSDLTASR